MINLLLLLVTIILLVRIILEPMRERVIVFILWLIALAVFTHYCSSFNMKQVNRKALFLIAGFFVLCLFAGWILN